MTDGSGIHDVMDERRQLLALCYRMMGTLSEAEDAVQETYVRWYRLTEEERAAVRNPAAWLTRVASRVCLDALTSARARRERYVGEWLPEPVPGDLFAGTAPTASITAASLAEDPLDRVTLDDAVSTALLVVLETMTPAERVSFVLHDVFAMPFPEIAEVVGRSPAAVRQLATSARRRVHEQRRTAVPAPDHDAVVRAFADAAGRGDLQALVRLLDPEVTLRSDGGGVVRAARNRILGDSNVARFVLGVIAKNPAVRAHEARTADGLGLVFTLGDVVHSVADLSVADGRIVDIRLMMNPAKLTAWRGAPRT